MNDAAHRPPVTIRTNNNPGKVVALVAGIHGNEFYGQAVLLDLAVKLRQTPIRGEIVIVPIANVGAARERARCSTTIPGDLNRQFGNTRYSTTNALRAVADDLWNMHLCRADVLIDIHSGGHQVMLPHYRFSGSPERLLSLMTAFDIRFAMQVRRLPAGLLIGKALDCGIRAVALEVGGGLALQRPLADSLLRGVWNLLIQLDCIEGDAIRFRSPTIVSPGKKIKAPVDGFFVPSVEVGAKISKGGILGIFTSLRACKRASIRTPIGGRVFQLLAAGPAAQGELVGEIVAVPQDA